MTMNSCGPFEILCLGCGTAFSVDAVKVASIVEQVKEQIGDRIRNEVKADQEKAVKDAEEAALAKARVKFFSAGNEGGSGKSRLRKSCR